MRHQSFILGMTLIISLVFFELNQVSASERPSHHAEQATGSTLSLDNVLTLVEEGHPLLNGSRTEKLKARGRLLKALGAFEPAFVNDWELERRVKDGKTESVGFNDTLVEVRHPWGISGFAGFRAGIGDVEIADLAVGKENQPLLGIALPLLRGFGINPEHAELKKSKLADKQANLEIQQTRQDLYLGAATQFWNWVAARKSVQLRRQALQVAKARLKQLSRQAKAGAVAPFDVTEANQEVQRRLENLIAAKRGADQEQFKLALFLWKDNNPLDLSHQSPPDFPQHATTIYLEQLGSDKQRAIQWRPEVGLVQLEAEQNNIDLDLATNNFLPDLQADAEPTRKPGEFVLGLGYRFGVKFSFPFLQKAARGEALQIEGKAQQLKFLQQYRIQQVSLDVENAYSALDLNKERIGASEEALTLARELEKGERTRFKLGATSLIFVNLRERNVVKAAIALIQTQADYLKALALYNWATGQWVEDLPST